MYMYVFKPVSKLAKPGEGLRVVHLLLDEFGYHITSMHINRAYCHNFLPVPCSEVTQEVIDELVQLRNLQIRIFKSEYLLHS